ncbi:MAG TPA: hypothetical protein VL357_01775 [Rariglobus sp.]|jgi:hypothetical protein|nr:hypothetical protein [Rariglobus sp.]
MAIHDEGSRHVAGYGHAYSPNTGDVPCGPQTAPVGTPAQTK